MIPIDLIQSSEEILSAREFEVLGLVGRGCKNREIAQSLGIAERTVRFHVEKILDKLNVNNRTEAVCYAFRNGLINN